MAIATLLKSTLVGGQKKVQSVSGSSGGQAQNVSSELRALVILSSIRACRVINNGFITGQGKDHLCGAHRDPVGDVITTAKL